jgi:hypothetical protein
MPNMGYGKTLITPDISATVLKIYFLEKEQISGILFFWKNILLKKLPLSIMVTRNPNWSTEILWFGTGCG